ncbi:hypothetical protein F2Q69_00021513 [Brassica cretica]|uniref:Uncharacterized protein n=1 Tax=Brassica cretica TaxID=69181 RepID=A0A8S9QMF6_BRACR|nr:hypothetical protein F2Q69_00021513 [Brassica cretica]
MSTLLFCAGGGELGDSGSVSLLLLFEEPLVFRLDFGVAGSSSSSLVFGCRNHELALLVHRIPFVGRFWELMEFDSQRLARCLFRPARCNSDFAAACYAAEVVVAIGLSRALAQCSTRASVRSGGEDRSWTDDCSWFEVPIGGICYVWVVPVVPSAPVGPTGKVSVLESDLAGSTLSIPDGVHAALVIFATAPRSQQSFRDLSNRTAISGSLKSPFGARVLTAGFNSLRPI